MTCTPSSCSTCSGVSRPGCSTCRVKTSAQPAMKPPSMNSVSSRWRLGALGPPGISAREMMRESEVCMLWVELVSLKRVRKVSNKARLAAASRSSALSWMACRLWVPDCASVLLRLASSPCSRLRARSSSLDSPSSIFSISARMRWRISLSSALTCSMRGCLGPSSTASSDRRLVTSASWLLSCCIRGEASTSTADSMPCPSLSSRRLTCSRRASRSIRAVRATISWLLSSESCSASRTVPEPWVRPWVSRYISTARSDSSTSDFWSSSCSVSHSVALRVASNLACS